MKFILLIFTMVFMVSLSAAARCICPAVYDPVCSTSGQTYGNRCQLGCAGATFHHRGRCGFGS